MACESITVFSQEDSLTIEKSSNTLNATLRVKKRVIVGCSDELEVREDYVRVSN